MTLRRYADARFTALERALETGTRLLQEEIDRREAASRREIDQRITDMNRAIDLSRNEMNRRLETMNEFRDAMRDQAARMLTKDAFELAIGGEKNRADEIHRAMEARLDKLEGKSDTQAGAVAAVAGRQSSARLTTGMWVGIAGLLVAVAAVVVAVIATRGHP